MTEPTPRPPLIRKYPDHQPLREEVDLDTPAGRLAWDQAWWEQRVMEGGRYFLIPLAELPKRGSE
jgi:hypothetical protein